MMYKSKTATEAISRIELGHVISFKWHSSMTYNGPIPAMNGEEMLGFVDESDSNGTLFVVIMPSNCRTKKISIESMIEEQSKSGIFYFPVDYFATNPKTEFTILGKLECFPEDKVHITDDNSFVTDSLEVSDAYWDFEAKKFLILCNDGNLYDQENCSVYTEQNKSFNIGDTVEFNGKRYLVSMIDSKQVRLVSGSGVLLTSYQSFCEGAKPASDCNEKEDVDENECNECFQCSLNRLVATMRHDLAEIVIDIVSGVDIAVISEHLTGYRAYNTISGIFPCQIVNSSAFHDLALIITNSKISLNRKAALTAIVFGSCEVALAELAKEITD